MAVFMRDAFGSPFFGTCAAVLLICGEFYIRSARRRRVVLHLDSRQLVLEHFVYPTNLFDVLPKPRVVVPFGDVLKLTSARDRHGETTIVICRDAHFRYSYLLQDSLVLTAVLKQITLENEENPKYKLQLATVLLVAAGVAIVGFFLWLVFVAIPAG